ncbi:MAG TPA: hypothetical protein VE569_08910, partial [Acidimicrobiia bacterium]|nr:hypothetical protein [Acidimicrobiia bacterium]
MNSGLLSQRGSWVLGRRILSAHHRKYVGVSTASDAACFVLVLDAPLRVRRRRRVLAIDAAASPK